MTEHVPGEHAPCACGSRRRRPATRTSGRAYIALFNCAFARQHGGQFILRIEDTDQARVTRGQRAADLRRACAGWASTGTRGPTSAARTARTARASAATLPASTPTSCSRTATPTAASARRSGWPSCATEQQTAKQPTGYDRLCRRHDRARSARRCRLGEPPRRPACSMPDDAPLVVRRPAARRGLARPPARRPGAAQVRRLADLPPGQRRRRPPDGDHPRDPRRGVDLVDAQARAALRRRSAGSAPRVRPHAAAAQRRQVEDLASARTRRRADVVPRSRATCPRRCSTSSALMGCSLPDGREKFTLRGVGRRTSTGSRVSSVGPVFDLDKLAWLNGHYIRELSAEDLAGRIVVHLFRGGELPEEPSDRQLALVRAATRGQERMARLEEAVACSASCSSTTTRSRIEPESAAAVLKGRRARCSPPPLPPRAARDLVDRRSRRHCGPRSSRASASSRARVRPGARRRHRTPDLPAAVRVDRAARAGPRASVGCAPRYRRSRRPCAGCCSTSTTRWSTTAVHSGSPSSTISPISGSTTMSPPCVVGGRPRSATSDDT